jgi:hypothetical protein
MRYIDDVTCDDANVSSTEILNDVACSAVDIVSHCIHTISCKPMTEKTSKFKGRPPERLPSTNVILT